MAKITPKGPGPDVITVTTKTKSKKSGVYKWYNADTQEQRAEEMLATFLFLKENQTSRYRKAALNAAMYQNAPLFNAAGSSLSKISTNGISTKRVTYNLIKSCVDTLGSRVTQSRPRPVFLTDNGDYKQRNDAKKCNSFINGEFYRLKVYDLTKEVFRDQGIFGPGVIKVLKGLDKKVALERRLYTELYVDPNEALYRKPRQLYEPQLMDRETAASMFPKYRSRIEKAEQAFPSNAGDSARSISDQILVVESWVLPTIPAKGRGKKDKGSGDGIHMIACSAGCLLEEEWTKGKFPFVMDNYSDAVLGMWGTGIADELMGLQLELDQLLNSSSEALKLSGYIMWLIEEGSKVNSAHINNNLGNLLKYKGTKPEAITPPAVSPEVYNRIDWIINKAYQAVGISALAAAAQKPAGLNSGEALRNYDDIQSDRFASVNKKYDNMHVDLAYQVFELAQEIAEEEGEYSTIYPNKNGTKEIDLPNMDRIRDTFVIQAFDASSLPRDPSGRLQKITEMIQSGMIDIKEGRRLLDFPDLEQVERLANSSEERLYQILDEIVEEGDYTPPDPYLNPAYAHQVAIQYYNLYASAKLEEEKQEMLRTFILQCENLITEATQPPPPAPGQGQPMAAPQPLPQSPLVPNGGIQ